MRTRRLSLPLFLDSRHLGLADFAGAGDMGPPQG